MNTIELAPGEVLVLRTCDADGISGREYDCLVQWPELGPVECPDWEPTEECGHGLHGLLRGCGDATMLSLELDALWQVVSVNIADCIDLDRKVKFPRGNVEYTGDRETAVELVSDMYPEAPVVYADRTVGDQAAVITGCGGMARAGYQGRAVADDDGTAIAGDYGTAIAGRWGRAHVGNRGTAIAAYKGGAYAGNAAAAYAGFRGMSQAGYQGTAIADDEGTAIVGDHATAQAGFGGKVQAGYDGILQLRYNDGTRIRIVVAYVGENGIKPDTMYCLDTNGNFIEATPGENADAERKKCSHVLD